MVHFSTSPKNEPHSPFLRERSECGTTSVKSLKIWSKKRLKRFFDQIFKDFTEVLNDFHFLTSTKIVKEPLFLDVTLQKRFYILN
ncbi:MAG: hypothetical protein U5L45_12815 [Saprospiraceae bacterium]|nr:hypothetical protein [Saprospiraceae bacterium]